MMLYIKKTKPPPQKKKNTGYPMTNISEHDTRLLTRSLNMQMSSLPYKILLI